jgi:hypothetical protein
MPFVVVFVYVLAAALVANTVLSGKARNTATHTRAVAVLIARNEIALVMVISVAATHVYASHRHLDGGGGRKSQGSHW